jgi:hypothetical protein
MRSPNRPRWLSSTALIFYSLVLVTNYERGLAP